MSEEQEKKWRDEAEETYFSSSFDSYDDRNFDQVIDTYLEACKKRQEEIDSYKSQYHAGERNRNRLIQENQQLREDLKYWKDLYQIAKEECLENRKEIEELKK